MRFGGLKQQTRAWFAAVAAILRCVGAHPDAIDPPAGKFNLREQTGVYFECNA
jgi:hypothetical protein